MKRISLTTLVALWLVLIVPQGALAAGGPVAPVQGSYIAVPGSPYRYGAFDAGGSTIVKRRARGLRCLSCWCLVTTGSRVSTTAARQQASRQTAAR
jgi:hypothetical protein